MKSVYIALGGNLHNPQKTFSRAIIAMRKSDIHMDTVSGLWASPSWPRGQGHPDYLNAVAHIQTSLSPLALLKFFKDLEAQFGRVATKSFAERNAPRPLDIDIIDYNGMILTGNLLTLPHPRMLDRGFVLLPLSQVCESYIHPVTRQDIWTAIAHLPLSDTKNLEYVASNWVST